MSSGNIKVVVRCRPLNSRELGRGAKGLIRMEGNQTILDPPENTGPSSSKATEKKPMNFSFDKSYWSAGPRDEPKYASQQTLYEDLGVDLLDHSFEGFNTCIFAYGQTGSGKSYGADKGIIPLTTSELFRRVEDRSAKDCTLSYTVEVSYIEIYNEKVRDLLNPKNKGNLRVREHPSLGPYVEDLSRLVVENYGQMMTLMDEGNKARTVASTNMNETSSRSHAVFTVILTQKRHDMATDMTGEKVSKISLVDLAGSERQASTGATGTRLKEGANINKSLTTLGKVIAALAQASEATTTRGKRKKEDFVPYRDSVLTWLLKESLGGNSKTAMIAAISPADYEETLSTLRYADAAKKIKTHAVVNEDPNAKLIRELKEELDMLRSRVAAGPIDEATYDPLVPPEKQIVTYKTKDGEIKRVTKLELQDQLQASEKLMESLNLTWEQKMAKTQAIHVEREHALEELGIMVDKDMVGVHAPQKHPSLVNLNEDPLMSECLVYQIKPGTSTVGGLEHDKAHIKLSGANILPEHCMFTNEDGAVTVEAMPDARTFVNGKRVPPKTPIKLLNGFRVILGDFHVFRFNDPAGARAQREKLKGSSSLGDLNGLPGSPGLGPRYRPDSPARGEEMMDWNAARRERADIEKLGDQDLDKLFDDIVKVRTQRNRPSSRMDLAAELESRFMSASQTEESLENPWMQAQGTTFTTNSLGTPVKLEYETEGQQAIEELSESATTADFPPGRLFDQRTADAVLEQQHLTKQLKTLAQELKRTKAQAAAATALRTDAVEPANWSARELRLVQRAVDKWNTLRTYKMAEELLMGAVNVREANVFAKTSGRDVTYNYLVVDGQAAGPTSSLDDESGVLEFEDVSRGISPVAGAVVVIKVVDKESQSVYTWDLERFSTQLNKMRHLRSMQQRPGHSRHFKSDGTFTDVPPPSYSFIGSTRLPLRLLNHQMSFTITLPIQCQYTMEAIGSCRASFKVGSGAAVSGVVTPNSSILPLEDHLEIGTKLTFSLVIDAVKGLSSGDFSSLHAQIRLSSLVGSGIASEDTYTSHPINLDQTSVAHLSLRRTVSVMVTPDMIDHFASGRAVVEFFAKVRPDYLNRLERFDRSRELAASAPPTFARPVPGVTTPVKGGRPSMRRCETDFVEAEHHDILASVSIHELASDGSYEPTDVINDIVNLHQGVQRRIELHLTHASGKALPWTKVEHFSSSDIRVKDKAGILGVSRPDVEVRDVRQELSFESDGTSTLTAAGVWDTAAHHCIHLDRRATTDAVILVKLTWLVEISNLDSPAVFQMDLPVKVLGRDARRSSLLALFSAPKIFKSHTAIYGVDLTPPVATSASDLWRLDTSSKHVTGEETLGDWQPRQLSLVDDWLDMKRRDRGLGDVQVTKVVLDLLGDELGATSAETAEEALRKSVDLWQREMKHRVRVDLRPRSEEEESALKKLRAMVPDLAPKLVPTVKAVNRVEHVVRQGTLMWLRDSQANEWAKRHFVLRRPYLHVHPSSSETEEQVVNLSQATVIPSPDVEMLLDRKFAFTVFSETNSYVLQASSVKEMDEWIKVIKTTSEG